MACLAAGSAGAETRALVVGVSGYPNLPASIRLTGPKNDSREFANTLARLGVPAGDITVLADGVSELAEGVTAAGPGTKQAILGRLDALAESAKPGDLVVFYFSGHGSQQPDNDGDEEGTSDQIFLPYDVGKWSGAGVENALVDDELNIRVQAILAKGADFFGVIDACHSATGFRALPGDDTLTRGVAPEELGVPAFTEATARATAGLDAAPTGGARGRAAFFYAAQQTEEALEKTPPGGAEGESFGVFTYNLISRLNKTPDLSYRTLHQAVMADIKRNALMATQTPEMEGELLDRPVLNLSAAKARRQWPIWAGKLEGGALDGVSEGSIVALFDDPSAPDDKALAHGVVETAGATRSVVTAISYPCAAGGCAEPDPALFKKGRFARVVEPGIDLKIVLSEPLPVDPSDGHDYQPAIAALRAAIASPALSSRVSLRQKGYDIAVGLVDGKLAFAPAGGFVDQNGPGSSPRLTLPDDPLQAAETVSSAVNRLARAMALQRMSEAGGAALGLSPQIRVSRAKADTIRDETCPSEPGDYDAPVAAGDAPQFGDCDILSVAMENTGRKPLDVTVLLIGADFSISPVWPAEGASNRLHAGDKKTIDLLQMEPDPKTATEERLVFVTVPGVNQAHTAFTSLEQEGLRAMPGEDEAGADVRDLFSLGLHDLDRTSVAKPARLDEELAIDVRPFLVTKGAAR